MVLKEAYLPEEHARFKEFAQECASVERMAKRVPELIGTLSPAEALFQAWLEEHPSPSGLAPFIGAHALFDLLVNTMILRAQSYFNHLRDGYLWAVASHIKPHNAASNPVDPLRLLELTRSGTGRVGTRVHRQVRWEAKQILAAALGFTAMELAHPERWISNEVTRIDQLSSTLLFAQVDLVDVYVVYKTDRENGGRILGTPFITLDEAEARRVHRRSKGILPSGGRVYMDLFQCRTIVDDSGLIRWLVENDDRRKTYFARLLKLHDGGAVRDSCGTSYMVAARIDAQGLHTASREDVDAVVALTEQRLWKGSHLFLQTMSPGNKRHRHPDYWDRKLIGRIAIEQDGRNVRSFVEQILTSLTDYLNQQRATDSLHHEIRRGEQLVIVNPSRPDRVPPALQYWPEEIYGKVHWSSEETIGRLRRSWALRFAGRTKKNV